MLLKTLDTFLLLVFYFSKFSKCDFSMNWNVVSFPEPVFLDVLNFKILKFLLSPRSLLPI